MLYVIVAGRHTPDPYPTHILGLQLLDEVLRGLARLLSTTKVSSELSLVEVVLFRGSFALSHVKAGTTVVGRVFGSFTSIGGV